MFSFSVIYANLHIKKYLSLWQKCIQIKKSVNGGLENSKINRNVIALVSISEDSNSSECDCEVAD